MALREDQILRYGRQILLREVGGRGQERLLAAAVRVHGGGPTIDDAIAWLVAGGTPVELAAPREVGGFVAGEALTAFSPDALPLAAPAIELLCLGQVSTAATQLVLGQGIAFRSSATCDGCWGVTLAGLKAGPAPAPLGSLAALVVQRLVLGLGPDFGLLSWTGDRFDRLDLRCPQH